MYFRMYKYPFYKGSFQCYFYSWKVNKVFFYLKALFVVFSFVWVQSTLPRFRYDKLMYLAWKSFLPVALNFCVFYMGMKVLLEVALM